MGRVKDVHRGGEGVGAQGSNSDIFVQLHEKAALSMLNIQCDNFKHLFEFLVHVIGLKTVFVFWGFIS